MKRKMVWVKNLETGLVWLVDEAHAARLLASGGYAKGDAKDAKAQGGRQGRARPRSSE